MEYYEKQIEDITILKQNNEQLKKESNYLKVENEKLSEKICQNSEQIEHLWAVKNTEYENMFKFLGSTKVSTKVEFN